MAFALARAIWGSAEADRPHALELANEARDGYAQIPDLAPRLKVVRQWIDESYRHTAPKKLLKLLDEKQK